MTPHLEQRLAEIAAENGYGAEIQHAMRLAAEAALPKWKKTADCLPQKPGKRPYEQIDCYVFVDGRIEECMWNCEHLVWDDESGDDFKYEPLRPTHWIEKLMPDAPKEPHNDRD